MVLDRRTLNRALLQRQMLAAPKDLPVPDAVERLVGLHAQLPNAPYVALWSRLESFVPSDLAELISARELVRVALMRSTIHLVTARDCRRLRPVVQPALDKDLYANAAFGPKVRGMDLDALLERARTLLAEKPLSAAELGEQLQERWPDRDPKALAYAVRNLETLVQVPPPRTVGEIGIATTHDRVGLAGRRNGVGGGRHRFARVHGAALPRRIRAGHRR